jgi:hypothetical protein
MPIKALYMLAAMINSRLRLCGLTHDADNEAFVERLDSDSQKKEANRKLEDTDREQVYRLTNEVELHSGLEVRRINILDMPPSSIVNFGYNDGLTDNTLHVF